MAAGAVRENRLSLRGLGFITPEEGVAVFEKLLQTSIGQVAVLPVDSASLNMPDLRRCRGRRIHLRDEENEACTESLRTILVDDRDMVGP